MQTKLGVRCLKLIRTACLASILGSVWVVAAEAQTFSGRAFGAFVTIPPVGGGLLGSVTPGTGPVTLVDTGALAPGGGWLGEGLTGTGIANVITAEVPVASTSGTTYNGVLDKADSSASLADVVVLSGSPAQLTASFVRAATEVTATGPQGSSEITGLTFGGVPVNVTGLPNQAVSLPGVGTLVINEQTTSSDPASPSIVVNALHLILATGGEVILSSASSAITF